MKTPTAVTLLTLSSLPFLSSCFPLIIRQRDAKQLSARNPATYSVVAVDGGSLSTAAATETITHPITTTLVSTLVSTKVVTESETPTTIVVTFTSTAATTIFETPSVIAATTTISAAPIKQTTSAISQDTTITVTALPVPATTETMATLTVTAMPTPASSEAYDDGMWHTTYYHAVTAEAAAVTSSTFAVDDGFYTWEPSSTATPSSTAYPTYCGSENSTANYTLFGRPRLHRL